MKILIYSGEDKLSFEKNRLRKNIKGQLELSNIKYTTSIYDLNYNIAHFLSLKDYQKVKFELPNKVKKVISLFYCLEDNSNISYKIVNNKPYFDINSLNSINEFDLILVPSIFFKEKLLDLNNLLNIEVLHPAVNTTYFSKISNYSNMVAYRYFQFNLDSQIAISLFTEKDKNVLDRLIYLANNFPKIKFVGIYSSNKVKFKFRNMLKKIPQNLIITPLIENDLYISLINISTIFLILGSFAGNVMQIYEAFAAETEIFALRESVFEDVLIDKENGYIYNNVEGLSKGLSDYLSNKLDKKTSLGRKTAVDNNLTNAGKKLLNLYKKL